MPAREESAYNAEEMHFQCTCSARHAEKARQLKNLHKLVKQGCGIHFALYLERECQIE